MLKRAYGSLGHTVFWICFSDCSLSLESVSFYGVFGQGPLYLTDDAQMVTVHCWERSHWKLHISNVMFKLIQFEYFIHFSYSHLNTLILNVAKLNMVVITLPIIFTMLSQTKSKGSLNICWGFSCIVPQTCHWNMALKIRYQEINGNIWNWMGCFVYLLSKENILGVYLYFKIGRFVSILWNTPERIQVFVFFCSVKMAFFCWASMMNLDAWGMMNWEGLVLGSLGGFLIWESKKNHLGLFKLLPQHWQYYPLYGIVTYLFLQ